MIGKKNFVSKAFCMFLNMDKMIGGEFEKGLASLKTIVEKPAEGSLTPTEGIAAPADENKTPKES